MHDGLNLLLGQPGSARSRRWAALSEQIPQAELDAIAGEKGYQHLAGRRNDLAFEWLARRTEKDFSLLEKGSLPQRMWDEFRELVMDLMASLGLKPTMGRSFEQQVQDLKIRARNAAMKPVKTHR